MPTYTPTARRHALNLHRTEGLDVAARETGITARTIRRWVEAEAEDLANAPTPAMPEPTTTRLADLAPHPRNYRDHPEDQLDHIVQSIQEHGFYRNVVAAKDGTLLAGHGVILAAERMGLTEAPVIHLDIEPDSAAAMKILAADNYLSHFSWDDDRMLTELLKDVADLDDLYGTGFDEQTLAALTMVTRPASEIADLNAAAEWAGMPEFDHEAVGRFRITLHFDSEEERQKVVTEMLGIEDEQQIRHGVKVWSIHWPPRRRDDPASIVFE